MTHRVYTGRTFQGLYIFIFLVGKEGNPDRLSADDSNQLREQLVPNAVDKRNFFK